MRSHTTRAAICLTDSETDLEYHLARLDYTLFEDETFQYVFTPNYSVIDLVGPPLFQGIPGLNLDLRRDRYVRQNRVPVFISERTPSENREDVRELLDAVGMDYLDPLEWLIRTDTRYGGDNLYAVRFVQRGSADTDTRSPADPVDPSCPARALLVPLCRGENIEHGGGFHIDDGNRSQMHALLREIYLQELRIVRRVVPAKPDGRRARLDEVRVFDVMERYEKGRVALDDALAELSMSRATFFRWLKRYRDL